MSKLQQTSTSHCIRVAIMCVAFINTGAHAHIDPTLIKEFIARTIGYTVTDATSLFFVGSALDSLSAAGVGKYNLRNEVGYVKGPSLKIAEKFSLQNPTHIKACIHAVTSEAGIALIRHTTKNIASDVAPEVVKTPHGALTMLAITQAQSGAIRHATAATCAAIMPKTAAPSTLPAPSNQTISMDTTQSHSAPPAQTQSNNVSITGCTKVLTGLTFAISGAAYTANAVTEPVLKKYAPGALNLAKTHPVADGLAKAISRLAAGRLMVGPEFFTDPKNIAFAVITSAYPLAQPHVDRAYMRAKPLVINAWSKTKVQLNSLYNSMLPVFEQKKVAPIA